MATKPKLLNYIGIIICLVGLVVSGMLIQEFYGVESKSAKSLCSAVGDPDSCKTVAESAYSGIRNVPLFGSIPVAVMGFTFYGLIGAMLILATLAKSEEDSISILQHTGALLIVGLVIDIALFIISKFIIGKICGLCFITYVVTIIALGIVFSILKQKQSNLSFGESFMKGITKNILNYAIFALGFFACGMGVGQYSGNGNQDKSKVISGDPNKQLIEESIKVYESSPVLKIDLTNAPMLGDAKAPITIVKFADYNCGHCMHASHILKTTLAEFSGIVKVYYKNFALDGNCNPVVQRKTSHQSSCIAASAAICANQQGKFGEVYTGLYADNEKGVTHSPASVLQIAKNSGLDINKFNACLASKEVSNQIAKEGSEGGTQLNIQSTPSLFVNNKAIAPGTPDPEFLRALIKHLMNKK